MDGKQTPTRAHLEEEQCEETARKMSVATAPQLKGILSLPNEILDLILAPLVTYTASQIDDAFPSTYWPKPDATFALAYSTLSGTVDERTVDPLQTQVFLVCKRFYQLGAAALYRSTLVFLPATKWGYDEPDVRNPEFPESQTHRVKQLVCSMLQRPRTHRFSRSDLVVITPNHWTRMGHWSDGEVLDENCAALAVHQPFWTKATVWVADSTKSSCFRVSKGDLCSARLLYGLGRLHCAEVDVHWTPPVGDEVRWAMQQPGHTPCLWPLYEDLMAYLDVYDEPASPKNELWSLNHLFRREAKKAAKEHDFALFFLNLEVAVDYVKAVVGQALCRPVTVFGDETEIDILAQATLEGEQLLGAREGRWRSGMIVSHMLAPFRRGAWQLRHKHPGHVCKVCQPSLYRLMYV